MGIEEKAVRSIRRITWIGLAGNVLISVLKFVLGINPSPSPVAAITTVAGRQALGLQPDFPPMTSATNFGQAVGLALPIEEDLDKA